MQTLRQDATAILHSAIDAVLPDTAVRELLTGKHFSGRVVLISVGKAAWRMAKTALELVPVDVGVVITKYKHAQSTLAPLEVYEASHPLPDSASLSATKRAIHAVSHLSDKDTVLLLLSGGGSSLLEQPLPGVTLSELLEITEKLMHAGANIVELNTVRKHLSAVKGGRFAMLCAPAKVHAIVLSDVLGDPLDFIASGPACQDSTTSEEALSILQRYGISVSPAIHQAMMQETPKHIQNTTHALCGSVGQLCHAAEKAAKALGYTPLVLSHAIDCEARDAGRFLAQIGLHAQETGFPVAPPFAILCGGETVVRVTGSGKGGRCQELSLAAAEKIAGRVNIVVAAAGSDGTDGPTDAAGAIVDGQTISKLQQAGFSLSSVLQENNAYPALLSSGDLFFTGPTGTNVNDLYFVLCGK